VVQTAGGAAVYIFEVVDPSLKSDLPAFPRHSIRAVAAGSRRESNARSKWRY